jgi:toxin ParE1/3/4
VSQPRIAFSEAAVEDVLEQSDWYEHQADATLSKRWERAVTTTLLRILDNPRSGAPCKFKSEELRDLRRVPVKKFEKHLIFYRFARNELLVLRVVHGARDLESLF